MIFDENKLLVAIENSFKAYKKFGAHSNTKLKPFHLFIAETLSNIWGKEYSIHFLGETIKKQKLKENITQNLLILQ